MIVHLTIQTRKRSTGFYIAPKSQRLGVNNPSCREYIILGLAISLYRIPVYQPESRQLSAS